MIFRETKKDYAQAKRDSEEMILSLGNLGLNVSIARCFSFVGKYLPRDQHFAIGNFLQDGLDGKDLNVKAKGLVYRSYMHRLRKLYYALIDGISEVEIIKNSTGFGLYDKKVVDQIKYINDPYPFLRGIISDLGYPVKKIDFIQTQRKFGLTKNNFLTLYDIAFLGIVSTSSLPLRVSSFAGFLLHY